MISFNYNKKKEHFDYLLIKSLFISGKYSNRYWDRKSRTNDFWIFWRIKENWISGRVIFWKLQNPQKNSTQKYYQIERDWVWKFSKTDWRIEKRLMKLFRGKGVKERSSNYLFNQSTDLQFDVTCWNKTWKSIENLKIPTVCIRLLNGK